MRFGLDYAWTHITAAEHKAAGSTFACRYLSLDTSKNLSAGEVADLRSGGIDIVTVWELTANRALGGYGTGLLDARHALEQAKSLGIPDGRPIYFAVDFDMLESQKQRVGDYFAGVRAGIGIGRTGIYGGYRAVKFLLDFKCATYAWQTYAWSGGNVDPRAHIYQYSNGQFVAGKSCDFNHALKLDFGQWDSPLPQPPKKAGSEPMITAVVTKNGIEVFVEAQPSGPGKCGQVFHAWQVAPNGAWHGAQAGVRMAEWAKLGTPGS